MAIDHLIIQAPGTFTLHVQVQGDAVIFQHEQVGKSVPVYILAIPKKDWSDINAFVRNQCCHAAERDQDGKN